MHTKLVRDLARLGQRGRGPMSGRGLLARIVGAVMRAAALAPRPGGRGNQQRRGRHVAQRDVAGFAFEPGEGADGFGKPVTLTFQNVSGSSHDFTAKEFFAASKIKS